MKLWLVETGDLFNVSVYSEISNRYISVLAWIDYCQRKQIGLIKAHGFPLCYATSKTYMDDFIDEYKGGEFFYYKVKVEQVF